MDDFPFSAQVRVRTYELDSFGHVNNSVYLNYMEEARSEYLKQISVSFHDFAPAGVQLVIAESYVRYLKPAHYGDAITVWGRFYDVRPASLCIGYRLTLQNGTVAAEGWTKGVFVQAATGKPTRAPEIFRAAFERAQTQAGQD